MLFFDQPILNSPYLLPERHWQLDASGRPDNTVVNRRRSSDLWSVLPGASAAQNVDQQRMVFEDTLSTSTTEFNPTAVVNALRQELDSWRMLPSPAQWKVTPTTQRLLQHWRKLQQDKNQQIRPFFCQIEAVEAAIWLAEVAPQIGKRGRRFLSTLNVANNIALQADGKPQDFSRPELLRIAFKLATGAGKTTVMAMLIAWQALNAVRSPNSKRFSKGFLIVAPGITIRDRLRVLQPNDADSYYTKLSLVPRDLLTDLNRAKIVITNYHAFKLRETVQVAKGTRLALEGHGEGISTVESEGQMVQRVMGDLMGMKNVLVINDEAHHCYRERPVEGEEHLSREENEERQEARMWLSGIEALNRVQGVQTVYDLSATPFFLQGSNWPEGTLFPWVMTDFSLMDAIECGIVKLPRVPVSDNRPDGQQVIYRDLWKTVGKRMPKKAKGETRPDPQKLPIEVKTALDALYGHYEETYRLWERDGVGIPPVFIVVCNNVTNSEMLRDYIAGYTRTDENDQETVVQGALDLFRNYDDHDQKLDRPRSILIDSKALESGDEIDKSFREAHAEEIEAFRRERLHREGVNAGNISDAEILREVMNTIGRKGKLGEKVRCVVSVSMLTEGWDANNVTHIFGLRAFGSRLICEQVLGRALRRLSYDTNPDSGLFQVEYADIMGIDGLNFSDQPKPAPPSPPRPVVQVHAVSPDRDACEITFPRVGGYRVDFPKERIAVDFSAMEPYVLTPEHVGATEVRMSGIIGESHDVTLEYLQQKRISEIGYKIASYWVTEKLRDPNQAPKMHLFNDAKRIVLQWLKSGLLECKDGTEPAQLLYRQLTDEVCDLLMAALVDRPGGDPIVRAVLDPFEPEGTTMDVSFSTSSDSRHWANETRSHVNWIVTDSGWETRFAEILDAHPNVEAYARNHNLGLEVPYLMEGEARRYLPDFLIRLRSDTPKTLVVEIKGFRGHDAMLKAQTIQNKWIPAVNRLGAFGRWAFAELRAVEDFRPDLEAAITVFLREEETP